MSNTYYTKTCLICPYCGGKTDCCIDHLKECEVYGPYYCELCGGGFKFKIKEDGFKYGGDIVEFEKILEG